MATDLASADGILTELHAVARDLSSPASTQVRIEDAVGRVADYLHAGVAVFYRRSPVSGETPIVYSRGLSQRTATEMTRGALVAELEAFVDVVAVSARWRVSTLAGSLFDRFEGLQTAASFPVWSAERVVGLLILAWREQTALEPHELQFCQAAATLLGVAVRDDHIAERDAELAVLRERTRFARDIHDSVAQSLTAVVLNLEAATRGLPDGSEALTAIEVAVGLARNSLAELRSSIWNLRAGLGRIRSLQESLADLADPLCKAGIDCTLEVHGDAGLLSEELLAGVVSIAREATVNVLRHSHAQRVEISVHVADEEVSLHITDDGIGAAAEPPVGSFGILGMQERAAVLGGILRLNSFAGHGTRVECIIPT